MRIIIGSSSQICPEFNSDNTYFIGRTNPHCFANYIQGYDLSTEENIEKTYQILFQLIGETEEDIELVFLNGVSIRDFSKSIYVNFVSIAKISEKIAKEFYGTTRNINIVLIGSASTYLGGKIEYASTKGALEGVMNSLNAQFKPQLRCNLILPSVIETRMIADWEESKRTAIAKNLYLGRFCTPHEIAGAIRFCLNNTYITGSVIDMTCGALKS